MNKSQQDFLKEISNETAATDQEGKYRKFTSRTMIKPYNLVHTSQRRSSKVLHDTLEQIQSFLYAQQVSRKAQQKIDVLTHNAANLDRRVSSQLLISEQFITSIKSKRPQQLKTQAHLLEGLMSTNSLFSAATFMPSNNSCDGQSSNGKPIFDAPEPHAFRSLLTSSSLNANNTQIDSKLPIPLSNSLENTNAKPSTDIQQHKEFMLTGINIISQMKKVATDLNLFENLDSTVQEIYNNLDRSYRESIQAQNKKHQDAINLQIKSASKKFENIKQQIKKQVCIESEVDSDDLSKHMSNSAKRNNNNDVMSNQGYNKSEGASVNGNSDSVSVPNPMQSNEFEAYMMTKEWDINNDSCWDLMSRNGSVSEFDSQRQSELVSEYEVDLTEDQNCNNEDFDVDSLLVNSQPQTKNRKREENKIQRIRSQRSKVPQKSTFQRNQSHLESDEDMEESSSVSCSD